MTTPTMPANARRPSDVRYRVDTVIRIVFTALVIGSVTGAIVMAVVGWLDEDIEDWKTWLIFSATLLASLAITIHIYRRGPGDTTQTLGFMFFKPDARQEQISREAWSFTGPLAVAGFYYAALVASLVDGTRGESPLLNAATALLVCTWIGQAVTVHVLVKRR